MEEREIKFRINLQLFSDSGEKTEEATSKRKEDSRKKGQVAKSPDIAQIATLLIGMVTLKALGKYYHSTTYSQFRNYFYKMDMTSFTSERMKDVMLSQTIIFFMLVMPVLMAVLITGVIFNYLQVGFLFTLEPIKPTFDKINPVNGIKNMFSMKKLFELCKNIAKMAVIGFYGYKVLKANFLMLLKTPFGEFQSGFYAIINMCYGFIFNATIALFIIALVDYFYQRWEHEKSMRMSKQEVKEEYKQTEGSPEVKGKLRAMRRELLKKKMIQNVPNATVVITNPTHISVALKYEEGMGAPRVIAKGEDKVAFKIREIAKENKIPIIENKPLARAMYKTVEIDAEIPEEYYQAVAEILSYIFREKNM